MNVSGGRGIRRAVLVAAAGSVRLLTRPLADQPRMIRVVLSVREEGKTQLRWSAARAAELFGLAGGDFRSQLEELRLVVVVSTRRRRRSLPMLVEPSRTLVLNIEEARESDGAYLALTTLWAAVYLAPDANGSRAGGDSQRRLRAFDVSRLFVTRARLDERWLRWVRSWEMNA